MLTIAIAAALTTSVMWNGVTLGAPVSTLRPILGDPLRIVTSSDGSLHAARYWIAGSNATFFIVLEKRGAIQAVHAFATAMEPGGFANVPADPSGVRLGDTLESVKAVHSKFRSETTDDGAQLLVGPVGDSTEATYEFKDGRVRSFQWTLPVADDAPAQPQLAMPPGDSIATAILDAQKDESNGVRWEYMYLAFTTCDGETSWKSKGQALITSGGRAYDRLHAVCPTTKAERDFFFDINAYFGKM
jgi:hypothetical protein